MPAARNVPSGRAASEIRDGMRIEGSVDGAGRAFMRTILAAVLGSIVAAALPAFAQADSERGKEVRIVGCVQWEKDYFKKVGSATTTNSC